MKSVKLLAAASLAIVGISPAFGAHFTVGGQLNGTFHINGGLVFGAISGPSAPVTIFPSGQTDADDPVDNGLPVTVFPDPDSVLTSYSCTVSMAGKVVNGVASVTSVYVSGSTKVCYSINQSMQSAGFPWRFHAMTLPGYTAILENISFYSPALFSCPRLSALANIGGGYVSFSRVSKGGCLIETSGNALSVTPSLDVVR